jgi:pilus assembly protein CpaF
MNAENFVESQNSNQSHQDHFRLQLSLAETIKKSLNGKANQGRSPEAIDLIRSRFKVAIQHTNIPLQKKFVRKLYDGVVDEIMGLGPIEMYMRDDSITEVMVNGHHQIFVEKEGQLIEVPERFVSEEHLQRTINKIVEPLGRKVDASSPTVDARLPDGSRVNAVVPPCAVDGATLTIRKFSKDRLMINDLVDFGSLDEGMAEYLEACVITKLNILVSGGTGTGKTTLLNALSGFIPERERIITIEDAAELRLNQRHVVRLETKPPLLRNDSEVTIRNLVKNSLRMRPDRIVVGECRGGEALDMLQAMNTGHDGSMTTIHANSPRDAISRLETLVLMAGMEIPISVARRQISSAINLIIQISRIRDGSRKVTQITEVGGIEGENVVMQPMFEFDDQGEYDGRVTGSFKAGRLRSMYDDRFRIRDLSVSPVPYNELNATKNGRQRIMAERS